MMSFPRVGIIGGMGPAATILLQQRLLDAVQVSDDDGHIPLLVDMNPQVPSRIDYLIHGTGSNPGPVLSRMARSLEAGGAEILAMPCCTAHHFAEHIEQSTSIPFLNMVALSVQEIAQEVPAMGKVGILASPASQKIGLFGTALKPHGFTAVYAEESSKILKIIEGIKRQGPTDEYIEATQQAVNQLVKAGVSAVLIGCSEFSLVANKLELELPVVDAVDVLARHIVHFKTVSNSNTGT